MASQAENWQTNFRVGKDLRGYCRGQITLRFVLASACSGEGHGQPTFTVIWGGEGVRPATSLSLKVRGYRLMAASPLNNV